VADVAKTEEPRTRKALRDRAQTSRRSNSARQKVSSAADISVWSAPGFALSLYRTGGPELVRIVKHGVPACFVDVLTKRMAMPKDRFYRTIGLIRPTVDRKVREQKLLNQDESERLVGITRLVGQVESMMQESGASCDFDAAKWITAWLDKPLPALGRKRPGEFMDTAIGRSLVADLLNQQQSSAYG
jgi:putative toxin-antitoxin system antitoxin component (TIGR02293 family)